MLNMPKSAVESQVVCLEVSLAGFRVLLLHDANPVASTVEMNVG